MNNQQRQPAASAADSTSATPQSPTAANSQPATEPQASSFIDSALESGRTALNSAVEGSRTAFDSAVESGRSAIDSGKKWIEGAHLRETVDQTTQSVKDWGNRAAARVNGLSTTQKVVGGAILAAGLGWLAYRKVKASDDSSSESSDSGSRSVYGRSGSFTRTSSAGYQAPDASNRRPANTSRQASMPSFGGASSDFSSRQSSQSPSSASRGYSAPSDDFRSVE